ncbi:MAG: hypothetical protein ACXV4A_09240 [Actinomycetes bacterium]
MPHPHAGARHGRWAPRGRSWWIGVLFAIGSTCFLVAPFPGFLQAVGSTVDSAVFFVGSLFFTSAAALQLVDSLESRGDRLDVWSSLVQLGGTLLFNVSTFRAMNEQIGDTSYNRLVWAPDALGSILFLISGYLAYVAVCGGLFRRPPRTRQWTIAAVNLVGCVAFGVSAVGAYLVPSTGDVLALGAANFGTAFGALCFLVGALLLLPVRTATVSSPTGRR